jgi:hypothetical protein
MVNKIHKETHPMKKFATLTTLLLMLAVSILPATAAQAQTDQYPAELAYYDAQIDLLIPHLDDFQYQYYITNGRYYQALESHSAAPDVPTVPDGIEQSPTDQPESLALFWEGYANLPDVLAWALRIDTYSGPDGEGYVLTVSTVINGEVWQRSINYGPDASRNAEWYPVENLDV